MHFMQNKCLRKDVVVQTDSEDTLVKVIQTFPWDFLPFKTFSITSQMEIELPIKQRWLQRSYLEIKEENQFKNQLLSFDDQMFSLLIKRKPKLNLDRTQPLLLEKDLLRKHAHDRRAN